jgi:hypothetical protein
MSDTDEMSAAIATHFSHPISNNGQQCTAEIRDKTVEGSSDFADVIYFLFGENRLTLAKSAMYFKSSKRQNDGHRQPRSNGFAGN